jgi:hypothetical protein
MAGASVTALGAARPAAAATGGVGTLGSPAVCSVQLTAPNGVSASAGCPAAAPAVPSQATRPAFSLAPRATVETSRYWFAMSPLAGDPAGTFVRVHALGDIVATRADGSIFWSRPAYSFVSDWGFTPYVVPEVLLGASPVDPSLEASERPYAIADVNADGVDDVVVAHFVRDSGFDSSGSFGGHDLTELTILDGRNGATLAVTSFPGYVTQVDVDGGTLVVGDETGDVKGASETIGENGSTSTLYGYSITAGTGGGVALTQAWSISTGAQWARWLALEPMAAGTVVAAWTAKPVGAAGIAGHVLSADTATGATGWAITTDGYPRVLRYDRTHDEVVVGDETDPASSSGPCLLPPPVRCIPSPLASTPYDYKLIGLNLADGSPVTTVTRSNAVLISLQVADLTSSGDAQWITGDAVVSSGVTGQSISAGRVAAADGGSGADSWSYQDSTLVPLFYGLRAFPRTAGAEVVAAGLTSTGTALVALSASGSTLWSQSGDLGFPLFLEAPPGAVPVVRLGDANQILHDYSLADGTLVQEAPLLGDALSVDTADVNGDGVTDLIVGDQSGGLFALDGRHLSNDPGVLWRTDLGAEVHKVQIATVNGSRVVVAATSNAVYSVDLRNGGVNFRIVPSAGYVFDFTLGDISGSGTQAIVIPTSTLAAYDAATGAPLWSYTPSGNLSTYFSSAVVTPDHRVTAELFTAYPRYNQEAVAVDGATGNEVWLEPSTSGENPVLSLWHSTAIDPSAPPGNGTGVVYTYEVFTATNALTIRNDVYGSTAGAALYSNQLTVGQIPMGTVSLSGEPVLEFNWFDVAALAPNGATEAMGGTASEGEPTSDLALADFGPLGKALLDVWDSVQAFPTDTPTGGEGSPYFTPEAAWSGKFDSGKLFVRRLDGSAADRVIAVPFDWDGYAAVAAEVGVGVFSFDLLGHGLTVLEAVPSGPGTGVAEAPLVPALPLAALLVFAASRRTRFRIRRVG